MNAPYDKCLNFGNDYPENSAKCIDLDAIMYIFAIHFLSEKEMVKFNFGTCFVFTENEHVIRKEI